MAAYGAGDVLAQGRGRLLPGDDGQQLAAAGQQPLDDLGADAREVVADDDDVAVDDARTSPGGTDRLTVSASLVAR